MIASLDWTPIVSSVGSAIVLATAGAIAALWRESRNATRDRDALNVRVATVVLPVLEQTVATLRDVAELTRTHEGDVRHVLDAVAQLQDTLAQLVAEVERVASVIAGEAYQFPGDRRRPGPAGRGPAQRGDRAREGADDPERGTGAPGGGAA